MAAQNEKRTVDLIINGKSAEVSMNQVKKEVIALTREFSKLKEVDNPVAYRQKAAEITKLTAVLKDMRAQINGAKTDSQKFMESAKQVAAGVLGGNLISSLLIKIKTGISDSIEHVKNLSDELTNIEKTTNLSADEVERLNGELGKIDTRTGRSELRDLAEEAGKLGNQSVEDVRKFVEETDMINVALGSDIGKDAIIEIARLAGIFGEEMLDIGSAINSIGQASVATEVFQVDFLKRTAGIGKQVGLTSKDLLGYGAALEIAGQTTEVSGTAMNQFLIEFTKDSEKFGVAAGMAKGQMKKLMDEKGTNAAFIEFLRLFKEGSGSAENMFNKLEDLGIDGQRDAASLVALAQNWNTVIEQQKVAAESAGSVVEEFNKRNNNAAANFEKSMKKMGAALQPLKETVGGFFIWMATGIANNIGLLLTLGKILIVGGSAWLAYRTIVLATYLLSKDFALVLRANTIYIALQTAATRAAAAAQLLFSGAMGRAVLAARLMNSITPGGFFMTIGTIIAGTVVAMKLFNDEVDKTTAGQRAVNEATTDAAKSILAEKNEYERNVKILKDKNNSEAVREAALKRMISLNPEWLGGLTLENYHTAEGIGIRNKYNQELLKSAELKAKIAKVDSISSEIEDLRQKKNAKVEVNTFGIPESRRQELALRIKTLRDAPINAEIKAKQDAIKMLNDDINKLQLSAPKKFTSAVTGDTYISEADMKAAEKAKKEAEAISNKKEKAEKKLSAEQSNSSADLAKQKRDEAEQEWEDIETEYNLTIEYSARKYRLLEANAATLRAKGIISEKEYQDYLEQLELEALNDRLKIHEEYGTDLTDIYYDISVKTLEAQERAKKDFSLVQKPGTFGPKNSMDANDSREKQLAEFDTYMNAASTGADMLDAIHQIQMHNQEKELDHYIDAQEKKRQSLESQLKRGLISEERYNQEKEKMDAEIAAKRKAMQEEIWKKQHRAAIIESTINGLVAVSKSMSQTPPPAGLPFIIATGILAGLQTAAIASEPMPQFYMGGRTDVIGASDGRRYTATNTGSFKNGGRYSTPSYGLIGEKGPELVVPNWIYSDPKYANVMGALEAAIYSKQFFSGGSTGGGIGTDRTNVTPVPKFTATTGTNDDLKALVAQNTEVMKMMLIRLNEPINAYTVWDQQGYEDYKRLRDRAKELGTF